MNGLTYFGATMLPAAPSGMPQPPAMPIFDSGSGAPTTDTSAVTAAVEADKMAALTAARAWTSAKFKLATAPVDAAAARAAAASQWHAGSVPGVTVARLTAANDGLSAAMQKAQANPQGVYERFLVAAWTATLNKVQNQPTSVGMEMNMGSGLDCFGCDYVGFDYGSIVGPIFQAAGGVTQGVIAEHEEDEKKQQATAADKKAADAVISVDQTASLANAKAMTSAKLKQPSASIDQVAASNAAVAQDRAGAGLSASASELRAKAADAALNAAVAKAQANPTDVYAQASVAAWTVTLNKAQNRQIVAADDGKGKGGGRSNVGGESWLTRKVVGPVPGYGVLLGGGGLIGGAALLFKKFF